MREEMREAFEKWADEQGWDKNTPHRRQMFVVYKFATASAEARYLPVIENLVSSFKKIINFNDLEMRDGDAARDIAEQALIRAEQLLRREII